MKQKHTHRPLNSRQKRFLDHFHETGNAGQSWIEAGYKSSYTVACSAASRFLQREDAQEYLKGLQGVDRDKSGLSRQQLIKRLENILDSEDARDVDVISACREIGRMIGAYESDQPANPPTDTLSQFMDSQAFGPD